LNIEGILSILKELSEATTTPPSADQSSVFNIQLFEAGKKKRIALLTRKYENLSI